MSDADKTPVDFADRPLMRSDLSMVLIQLDGMRKAVRGIEQLAIQHYTEATATRKEGRALGVVCVASAIVCIGCSLGLLK